MTASLSAGSGENGAPRFESYPERLVREAIERGEFDDNPYRGRPVRLGRPGAEKPWIVERLEREDLSGVLPEALRAARALREQRAERAGGQAGTSDERAHHGARKGRTA